VRVRDADDFPELARDEPDRGSQIGVIGDDYGDLECSAMSIMDELRREMDVGTLLFLPPHAYERGPPIHEQHVSIRIRARQLHSVAQEVPQIDRNLGACRERPEIRLLPGWAIRVVGAG